MITKQQAEKLRELIFNLMDAQYEYDQAVSRIEEGYADLAYDEVERAESDLNSFIEELTNDNECQN